MTAAKTAAIEVRQERLDDEAAVDGVVEAAFGGRRVPELVRALRESWCFEPELSFVAEVGGDVVGHVLFTHAFLDADPRTVGVLVLSPLSVRTDWHGRGVARALLTHALSAVERRGEPLVFLEGVPSLYPKFGFQQAAPLGFVKPSRRIPDVAFMVRPQSSYEDWMTGALVYPDVFWQHDCVGLRDDGRVS